MDQVESLLTKYRPKDWKDVIGQDKAMRSMAHAVESNKSHAYLMTGPSGVGKTTVARIAAEKMGCTSRTEIDAATFTGIDDIRSITEGLPYRLNDEPTVIIIDECHALSQAARQALLKSLEDPPAHVFWFLCTTEEGKIPVTIKTRCLHYPLKPVSEEELGGWLADIAEKEGFPGEGGVIDVCVKAANGSPRQALANLAVCAQVKDRGEAAELLRTAEESAEAVDLARILLNGGAWRDVQAILAKLKDKDAESIRRTVCAYMTSVVIKVPKEHLVGRATEILDVFDREPFYHSTGISSVAKACAVLLLK